MKKTVCLLLLVMLLVPCCTGFASAEADAIPFAPSFTEIITNATNYTASDWFGTSYNRAMVTLTLALDLSVELSIPLTTLLDWMADSYVGRNSYMLMVAFFDTYGTLYSVAYAPSLGLANYGRISGLKGNSWGVQTVLQQHCGDGVYRNELTQIVQATKDLNSALGS